MGTTAQGQARSFGFVCADERIECVQRRPTPAEADALDAYRHGYEKAMGRWPHGLHYLPLPDAPETVAVWFPPVD